MITIQEFSFGKAAMKYYKSDSVSAENLYGNWEVIASFFTLTQESLKVPFKIEGRKFSFQENNKGKMDNTAFGYDVKDIIWEISDDGKYYLEGEEKFRVRLEGDTMEWIGKVDIDYLYFVLVRH